MGWFFNKNRNQKDGKTGYFDLPEIPVECNTIGTSGAVKKYNQTFHAMLEACRAQYGATLLKIADYFVQKWVTKKADLLGYEDELHESAAAIKGPGKYALNLSYEFACTTGVKQEHDQSQTMFRAFDWPVKNLADKVIILKRDGKAGHYWDMTYPGMVGVIQAMAPRRFAISINRAPIPVTIKLPFFQGITKPLDRWVQRFKTYKTGAVPAPFLLRKVFDECASYDEAVEMLSNTMISAPTIFTIAGVKDGEACVIERDREGAYISKGCDAITANHWQNKNLGKAHPRPINSHDRLKSMRHATKHAKGHFDWASGTLVNDFTRLVFEANPKQEILRIYACEGQQQVTRKSYLRLP